jgi:preprotein translocase subunit SecG
MLTLVLVIHLICCLILILVILLQSGKSADLAGAFGMMGSQTAFGPRGTATLLSKVTTGAAVIFMVSSLALSFMMSSASGGSSIMDRKATEKGKATSSSPAKPAQPKPAPTGTRTNAPDLPGGVTVDVKGGKGAVGNVQAKPLTKEEYDAMMQKGPKAPPKREAPAEPTRK